MMIWMPLQKGCRIWASPSEAECSGDRSLKSMEFKHASVLLEETIENLKVKPDGIYVDGTLGGGGHALEVCRRLSARGDL